MLNNQFVSYPFDFLAMFGPKKMEFNGINGHRLNRPILL